MNDLTFNRRKMQCQALMMLLMFFSTISLAMGQDLGDNLTLTGPGAGADGSSKAEGTSFNDVRDADETSYWQPTSSSNERISVKWSSAITFNTLVLKEPGDNVTSWELVNNDNGASLTSGTTIGSSLQVNLGDVSMSKINLVIHTANAAPTITEFEVYNATGGGGSGTTIVLQESEAGFCDVQGLIESEHSGFTGSGYANADNTTGTYISWDVDAGASGTYSLKWRFANGGTGDRTATVEVNGTSQATGVSFPVTGAWTTWDETLTVDVSLAAGSNTVRLIGETSSSLANIDYIEVTGESPSAGTCGTTQYTLTTSTVGQGTVTLDPSGGTYDAGTEVTVTANPAAGWQFDGWSGDLTGTTNPATVVMDADKSITATFSETTTAQYTLTTATVGEGTVTLDPAGGTYDDGTTVTLTANPASGWQFDSWSGDLTSTTNPESILMDSDKSVTANFSESTGGGGDLGENLAVTGPGAGADGSSKAEGTSFNDVRDADETSYWQPTSSSNERISVKWSSAITFNTLVLKEPGDNVTSWELVNNDNGASLTSGTTIGSSLQVNLGDVSMSKINLVIHTANAAPTITEFEVYNATGPVQYTLTTAVVGQGTVTLNPAGGTYEEGDTVTVTANPATGWQFDGWSGDLTGTTNPATVIMDSDKSVTATFSDPNALPGKATNPDPSNGAGSVQISTSLSWTAGSGADSHDVYFGTSSTLGAGDFQGNQTSTTWTPAADLATLTTYYWRIDEVNANGTTQGDVWSFTTNDGSNIDFSMIGYATLDGGTTGGAGGTSVTVSTGTDLQNAISNKGPDPLTIYVDGTITPSNSSGLSKIDVKDVADISILGVENRGEFNGIGIKLTRTNNIIIRNLKIHHVDIGDKDCISIEGPVDHVWIDHCELYNEFQTVGKDYYDGLLDIKRDADYITISWNYFHDSWKASLSGSSDSDSYHRRVTYHHNYYVNNNSRLPLFRFGEAHIFNNYYDGIESTGINSRMGACVKVENTYFENAHNPIVSCYSSELGATDETGNVFGANVTWDISGSCSEPLNCTWTAPYAYSSALHAASEVPTVVPPNVGVGVIDPSSGARLATVNALQPAENLISVYPNPVGHSNVNIQLDAPEEVQQIRLININGQEVVAIPSVSKMVEVDVSTLAPGLYFLQIETTDGMVVRKLVKQ